MNMNWHVGTDPRQRWVGIEVLFEPDLDGFMDVSNDKQQARGFFKRDISEDAENYEITETKYKEKLREEGHQQLPLYRRRLEALKWLLLLRGYSTRGVRPPRYPLG